MFVYVFVEAVVGVVAGILIAIRAKKEDGVVYGKLDVAGRITNIVLTCAYVVAAPIYMLIGMLCEPAYEGILGLIGWIVSAVIASAGLVCGVGLGMSVALRKKGRSKLSFAVQFAGVAAIGLSLLLFLLLYGNLLSTLN